MIFFLIKNLLKVKTCENNVCERERQIDKERENAEDKFTIVKPLKFMIFKRFYHPFY